MFNQTQDERLSSWSKFRKDLEGSTDPLQEVAEFWALAPFIPFNREVDPYNSYSWPTPWEIIVNNKYDEFTRALIMSWTLKLTDRFKNSNIEIKTITTKSSDKEMTYNVVVVDEQKVLNYRDNEVILVNDLPQDYNLENIIQVKRPR